MYAELLEPKLKKPQIVKLAGTLVVDVLGILMKKKGIFFIYFICSKELKNNFH